MISPHVLYTVPLRNGQQTWICGIRNCCFLATVVVPEKENNPINLTIPLSMQLLVHYYQAVPT